MSDGRDNETTACRRIADTIAHPGRRSRAGSSAATWAAKDHMIEASVVHIAKRYQRRRPNSRARSGLVRAVEKFEFRHGPRCSTYADALDPAGRWPCQ